MNRVETENMNILKSRTENEGYISAKEAELLAIKAEIRELEESDPADEHRRELDGTAYVLVQLSQTLCTKFLQTDFVWKCSKGWV